MESLIALFFTCSGIEYNLRLAVAAVFLAIGWRIPRMSVIRWLWVIFMAWAFVCSFTCEYPALSILGHPLRSEGALWLIIATFISLTFPKKWIFTTCFAISLSMFLLLFLQNQKLLAYCPHLQIPRFAGGIASILAVILFAKDWRLLALAIPLIDLSESRTAWIASLLGCLSFWAFNRKWFPWTWTVIGIICLYMIFTTTINHVSTHYGTGVRANLIIQGSKLAAKCPLTGFGMDTLSKYLKKPACSKEKTIDDRTHYLPLDVILQTGWIGYAMMLTILGTLLYKARTNAIKLGVVTSWCIFNMINPSGFASHELALIILLSNEDI